MKTPIEAPGAPSIAGEFANACFGDRRLTMRLLHVAEACAQDPTKSLPQAMGSRSDTESAYRFFNNDGVAPQAILATHFEQTVQRAGAHEVALVLHDTTEFQFSTDRDGLGYLRSGDHGFLMHCAFAVSGEGLRRPLGVLGMHTWTRHGTPKRKLVGDAAAKARAKESARWLKQVEDSQAVIGERACVIHIMDREGDAYPLVSSMVESEVRFIVRMARDRTARENDGEPRERVRAIAARAEDCFQLDVPLSPRAVKGRPQRASLAPRDSRIAKLVASATPLEIKKPPYLKGDPMWTEVNVVRVREVETPEDVTPVDWVLLTNEPIDTARDVISIIERYRSRWLIEEFFKAIKTGCEYEKLQLESLGALVNALAMFLPIAWRMLLLRNLARTEPTAPAETVLTESEIEVLRAFPPMRLPARLTIRDALLAVATMGGYLKHKKPPGWLTLARGFEKLTLLELGWSAARQNMGEK